MNVHANDASSAALLMPVRMVFVRRRNTYTMLQAMRCYQELPLTISMVT